MTAVLCFAHGNDDAGWEAICVDFDIAVSGRSFDEVKKLLDDAVASYVADVRQESEDTRRRLLSRRAPWHVRFMLTARLVAFNLFRGRSKDGQASFPVACPA